MSERARTPTHDLRAYGLVCLAGRWRRSRSVCPPPPPLCHSACCRAGSLATRLQAMGTTLMPTPQFIPFEVGSRRACSGSTGANLRGQRAVLLPAEPVACLHRACRMARCWTCPARRPTASLQAVACLPARSPASWLACWLSLCCLPLLDTLCLCARSARLLLLWPTRMWWTWRPRAPRLHPPRWVAG